MKHHYSDIRDKIKDVPEWFDENGVPRYCKFAHDQCANIYAREVVLLLIACQNCGATFPVCMSDDRFRALDGIPTLAELIRSGTIHYGDPPNVGCCEAGPTMNCVDLEVLEYWHNPEPFEWVRVPELEVELPDMKDWKEHNA